MTTPVPLPSAGDESWMDWAAFVHEHVTAPETGVTGVDYDNVPAGSVFVVPKNPDGTWPDRPSTRVDIVFDCDGPAPGPAIVTPPATNGYYSRNLSAGVRGDRWSLS